MYIEILKMPGATCQETPRLKIVDPISFSNCLRCRTRLSISECSWSEDRRPPLSANCTLDIGEIQWSGGTLLIERYQQKTGACVSYLLNWRFHHVPNDAYILALSHAENAANGLVFYVWVPLRFENVYAACYRKVVQSRYWHESPC